MPYMQPAAPLKFYVIMVYIAIYHTCGIYIAMYHFHTSDQRKASAYSYTMGTSALPDINTQA